MSTQAKDHIHVIIIIQRSCTLSELGGLWISIKNNSACTEDQVNIIRNSYNLTKPKFKGTPVCDYFCQLKHSESNLSWSFSPNSVMNTEGLLKSLLLFFSVYMHVCGLS